MSMNNAYYRYGASATPLHRGQYESLRTIGALGPVTARVEVVDLVDKGLLAKPVIRMVTYDHVSVFSYDWHAAYRAYIVLNNERNDLLADMAERAVHPTLLFVEELDHAKEMLDRLTVRGLYADVAVGRHSKEMRKDKIAKLEDGRLDVLVCTVIFQEGIDIPTLQSVVVGSGKSSAVAALQRIGRGMRKVKGKDVFEVWDVYDMRHRWFEEHAKKRKDAYESLSYAVAVNKSL